MPCSRQDHQFFDSVISNFSSNLEIISSFNVTSKFNYLLMAQLILKNTHEILAMQTTAQKVKFSIKDFFSKCDQICRKLRIWSHLLKKSLMGNFLFYSADIFVILADQRVATIWKACTIL